MHKVKVDLLTQKPTTIAATDLPEKDILPHFPAFGPRTSLDRGQKRIIDLVPTTLPYVNNPENMTLHYVASSNRIMNLAKKSNPHLRNEKKRSFTRLKEGLAQENSKYSHLNSLLEKTSYRASSTILNDFVKGGQELADISFKNLTKDSSILFKHQEGTSVIHLKDMMAEQKRKQQFSPTKIIKGHTASIPSIHHEQLGNKHTISRIVLEGP